jgi:hypothetical protein
MIHVALISNVFMLGIIIFVRFVHYPLFLNVDSSGWKSLHLSHVISTRRIVAGPMAAQLLSTIAILATEQNLVFQAGLAAALLLSLGTTALLSMPLHSKLALGFDSALIKRLMQFDGVRILGWSAGTVLLLSRVVS